MSFEPDSRVPFVAAVQALLGRGTVEAAVDTRLSVLAACG
jgi:hypothetical protein